MAKTPTVFRWDDVGAPDINSIMPSQNDKKNLMIYTILKACLVTGYGTKQAAGWTMPHEEIAVNGCRFSLKNAAGSGALLYEGGIFSGGATDLNADALWACLDVTNLDTPLGAWSLNVPYSSRSSGSSVHKSGLRFKDQVTAWVVIANENTCIFISGNESTDFNTAHVGVPSWQSTKFIFGAMHDGIGGVANPAVGNFYLGYGAKRPYTYDSYYPDVARADFTSCQDVLGVARADAHTYEYSELSPQTTSAPLNAWLPVPIVYSQYGPSGPDGSSSGFKYFSAAIPSLRRLLLSPLNIAGLNSFMVANSFSYGSRLSYQGSEWIVFKSHSKTVDVFSLEPAEWGA